MTLEDHIGDMVRKLRLINGLSLAAVARVAGLSEAELADLEANGLSGAGPRFRALEPLLGVGAGKLEGIAAGWLPVIPPLGTWRELRTITTDDGGMAVNAYLAWDEATREAALFDTGWIAQPVEALAREHNLRLKHVFITHSHEDHVAALDEIRQRFPGVRVHSSSSSAPVAERNRAGDFVHLGSLRITHRDTPGHAVDGTTYVIGNWPDDAPHVAIVGDAIFAGSIGKGNQSWELARQKVREQILSLPPETLICPGHGPLTTVAQEKAHNPFF